jgi:hypothetical protein
MTGDAVDDGVGGRETRRDQVVAGLAQHDPGDRRPLAVDPADGPETMLANTGRRMARSTMRTWSAAVDTVASS